MSDAVKLIFFVVVPAVLDAALILLFIRGVMIYKKRKARKDGNLVSLSPLLLGVGAVCGALFSVSVYFMNRNEVSVIIPVLFEIAVLTGIAMILAYCNETVVYDSLEFTAKNFLGVKRTFSYGDITGISKRGRDVFLYCGRGRIRLDTMASGKDEFVRFAERICPSRKRGKIPPRERKTGDPMRGNLDAPWVYLFLWLIFIAILIFFTVLSVYFIIRSDDPLPSIILLSVVSVAYPFPVFGIVVGRHPEKFPEKFRRAFYKDDAWSIPFRMEETMRKNQKNGK